MIRLQAVAAVLRLSQRLLRNGLPRNGLTRNGIRKKMRN